MPLPAESSGQFLIVSFQVKHALLDAVTPLLGVYPGEMKACPQRQMFTGVLSTTVMLWKQPKCQPADLANESQCPHLE